MIPVGTPNPPLRRVVDAPFTSKSHFGLLAVRCLSYMGWGSPYRFTTYQDARRVSPVKGPPFFSSLKKIIFYFILNMY